MACGTPASEMADERTKNATTVTTAGWANPVRAEVTSTTPAAASTTRPSTATTSGRSFSVANRTTRPASTAVVIQAGVPSSAS